MRWVRNQLHSLTIHYLVGGLEHFHFFHIWGISSIQLTFIFFMGVGIPPNSYLVITDIHYYALLSPIIIYFHPLSSINHLLSYIIPVYIYTHINKYIYILSTIGYLLTTPYHVDFMVIVVLTEQAYSVEGSSLSDAVRLGGLQHLFSND